MFRRGSSCRRHNAVDHLELEGQERSSNTRGTAGHEKRSELSIDTGERLAFDVQYPDGISIHRDYNARGQLKSVTDSLGSQPVIDYTYLPDGKVDHADYRNGVHTAYGYDGRGMIGTIQYSRGDGANLSTRTYWRDERDRITAYQKSTQNSGNPMENGRGDRFRYDEEGQLVEAWD